MDRRYATPHGRFLLGACDLGLLPPSEVSQAVYLMRRSCGHYGNHSARCFIGTSSFALQSLCLIFSRFSHMAATP